MHDLAHELCEGRWVATGGGGYDIWRVVPRAWTSLWAAVSHQELPERVSEDWLSQVERKEPGRVAVLSCATIPRIIRRVRVHAKIAERNLRTVEEVVEKVLPRVQQDE